MFPGASWCISFNRSALTMGPFQGLRLEPTNQWFNKRMGCVVQSPKTIMFRGSVPDMFRGGKAKRLCAFGEKWRTLVNFPKHETRKTCWDMCDICVIYCDTMWHFFVKTPVRLWKARAQRAQTLNLHWVLHRYATNVSHSLQKLLWKKTCRVETHRRKKAVEASKDWVLPWVLSQKKCSPQRLGFKKKVVSFPTTYWSVPSVPAKLGHWGSQTVNGTSMVSWVKCSDPKHGDIWRYDKYREKLRKKIWIRYIPLYYIIYYTIYIL